MIFTPTELAGLWRVDLERHPDGRGFFARSFCKEEFRAAGLETTFLQHGISGNTRRHTLRGMHFQIAPHQEIKLISCIRGAVFDVVIDLRPDSSTYLQWHGQVLDADTHTALYVPAGFAHGFQTLSDGAELFYQLSASYVPGAASGVRWDDPLLAIEWPPAPERIISDRDRTWPDYEPQRGQNSV